MKQLQKIACNNLVIFFLDETESKWKVELYFCWLVIIFDEGNVARQIIYFIKCSVNLLGEMVLIYKCK